MKRLLIGVMAALCCLGMQAQDQTSSTQWYVKAGLNLSNISAYGISLDPLAGYHLGVAFDKPIGSQGLYWGAGLQLATKGCKVDGAGDEGKVNVNKLELPVTLAYKFPVANRVLLDIRAGVFANVDLFGKAGGDNISDVEDWERFSAGLQGGIGAWLDRWNINVTYQGGFVKWNGVKERNWMIGLGYAF
jgi:hypothetical protein